MRLALPPSLMGVPYVGARYPGSPAVLERPGISFGANCQTYAYAVLDHFGVTVPPLRSSELWTDTSATDTVTTPSLLDLLLFNEDATPFGAHVGVWAGDDQVLHLCREVGHPALWTLADFRSRTRYRTLVGVKRPRVRRR